MNWLDDTQEEDNSPMYKASERCGDVEREEVEDLLVETLTARSYRGFFLVALDGRMINIKCSTTEGMTSVTLQRLHVRLLFNDIHNPTLSTIAEFHRASLRCSCGTCVRRPCEQREAERDAALWSGWEAGTSSVEGPDTTECGQVIQSGPFTRPHLQSG